MRTTRRQLLTGALAVGALTGLAGCTTTVNDPSMPRTKLTIGLTYIPNVQFSPFYVALKAGLFTGQELDVTLRHHGAQEDAFGAMLAGKEDVVFASGDESVVASANGSKVSTFGTGFQEFPGVLLAPAASGISSVEDLRGRRIGIPGHYGSTYYTVLAALHLAGLAPDDVIIQDIGYTQVSALSTGAVDVVAGYSNNETVQFANAEFDVAQIAVQDPSEPSLVGPGLVTVPGNLGADVLTRINAAVLEAERRIVSDPDLAIEATRREVPTLSDPQQERTARLVLEATTKLWLRDGVPSLEVDVAAFERMGGFLTEAGIISAPPKDLTITV